LDSVQLRLDRTNLRIDSLSFNVQTSRNSDGNSNSVGSNSGSSPSYYGIMLGSWIVMGVAIWATVIWGTF
jgi:hypothetical protein